MPLDHCHRISGISISHDYRPGYVTIVRIACKMWSCPYCGPRNAIQWRAYLLDRFNKAFGFEKWCFYTITAHRNAHISPEMTILNLQQVWKRLYDRLRRRFPGKKLQYVRVFERHKSGRFHMHFLLNVGLEYDKHAFVIRDNLDEFRHPECKWLRKTCAELGGGWRVHIRRVWDRHARTENVGLVVGYLLKYMGKSMADFPFPKRQRRVQTSRLIGSPATGRGKAGTWEWMRELPLNAVAGERTKYVDMSTGEVLTPNSFEGEHYYPPLRYYGARGEGED